VTQRRYLIATDCFNYDPRPGLGWMVWANSVAWRYAKVTGRTLVVDWRDTEYLSGKDKNLFTELFEPPGDIDGVKVICEDLDRIQLPGPRLVTTDQNFTVIDKIIAHDRDLREPTVEIRGGMTSRNYERFFFEAGYDGFIRNLRLRLPFREFVEGFLGEHFEGRKVMGVQVRHGNGEQGDFQDRERSITDMGVMIEHVKSVLEPHHDEGTALFLTTDSQLVIDAFQPHFPNLVVREQWRPAPYAGNSLHLGRECPDGEVVNAANAWIDMYLLGCCDVTLFTRLSHMNTVAVQLAKGRADRKILYSFDVERAFAIGRHGGRWPRSRFLRRTLRRASAIFQAKPLVP
jgi:hypothetical protein